MSALHALPAEVRLYENLFLTPKPDEEEDWRASINPNSLERLTNCYVEPSLTEAKVGNRYQFERTGYFLCGL